MTPRAPESRRSNRARGVAFLALISAGTVFALAGCSSPKKPPPRPPAPPAAKVVAAPVIRPLCSVETAFDPSRPVRERTFPAQNWFVLLLHSYRSDGELARPLNDCSGTPVKVDEGACGDDWTPRMTPTALTGADLIVTPLGDNRRLVWVMTERLSDGQAQGPVAIATVEPRGIAVRALGVLRSYPDNVSLRLERVNDATVLVADGQRCADPQVPQSCERAIRLVPLVGTRFISTGLLDPNGACLGSTLFPVRVTGKGGRNQASLYSLEASMTFAPNGIVVREHLDLSRAPGRGGSKDQSAESFVTKLQLERQVTVRNGRLVSDGTSLFTRWLTREQASGSSP